MWDKDEVTKFKKNSN